MSELISANPDRLQLRLPDAISASRMGGGHDARTLLRVFGNVLEETTGRFYKESRKTGSDVIGYNRPFSGQDRGSMSTSICFPYYRPGQHLFLGTWAAFRLRAMGMLDIEHKVVTANLVKVRDVNLRELHANPERWFKEQGRFIAIGLGFGDFNPVRSWRFDYTRGMLDRFHYMGLPDSGNGVLRGVTIDFREKNLVDIGSFVGLGDFSRCDILGDRIFKDGNEISETLRDVALKTMGKLPGDGLLVPPPGLRHNLVMTIRRLLHDIGLA